MSRRLRRAAVPAAAVLLVAALGVLGVQRLHPSTLPWNRAAPLVAAAYLPVWDAGASASLDAAARSGLSEVSPVWATVNPDGSLAADAVPAAAHDAARQKGLRLIPTVQNTSASGWQGTMVAGLLTDPAAAQRHVGAIVTAAAAGHWQGVDIDYETLPPTAGPEFTAFLRSLAGQLHDRGMVLTVAVPARTADQGEADTLAYPYQVIGSIADEVRVMAYDYSYSTSDPGPIAPHDWVESVVAYAVARVPADKLMLGLATYGYDWVGRSGTDIGAADAASLARRVGVTPTWHGGSGGTSFSYESDGQRHTVWYEDARSVATGQQVAIDHRLRGVAIWRLGTEDPQTWTSVAAATGRVTR